VYRAILQHHVDLKRQELEQPVETNLDGFAQALRAEGAKGAIMGLRLAISIPDGIINNDKMLRQGLRQLGVLPEAQEEDDDA
jgi:hypothetical protein